MFCQFSTRWIARSWFRKLFRNQCCDVVQNLLWHYWCKLKFFFFHSVLLNDQGKYSIHSTSASKPCFSQDIRTLTVRPGFAGHIWFVLSRGPPGQMQKLTIAHFEGWWIMPELIKLMQAGVGCPGHPPNGGSWLSLARWPHLLCICSFFKRCISSSPNVQEARVQFGLQKYKGKQV